MNYFSTKHFTIFTFLNGFFLVLFGFSAFARQAQNMQDDSSLSFAYSERVENQMRHSYMNANSDFANAFRNAEDFHYTASLISGIIEVPIIKTETPTVGNISEYASDNIPEEEKILVVLVDAYGIQNYSKVVITDVDMEQSILIAKDIFDKFSQGVYTVVASSANDLVRQKLIIQ